MYLSCALCPSRLGSCRHCPVSLSAARVWARCSLLIVFLKCVGLVHALLYTIQARPQLDFSAVFSSSIRGPERASSWFSSMYNNGLSLKRLVEGLSQLQVVRQLNTPRGAEGGKQGEAEKQRQWEKEGERFVETVFVRRKKGIGRKVPCIDCQQFSFWTLCFVRLCLSLPPSTSLLSLSIFSLFS